MMRALEIAEAQSRLAELIRDVERGESVAITCDGRTVAHIVPEDEPARLPLSEEEREAAMERLMQLRAELKPAGITREEILSWIREGRKM